MKRSELTVGLEVFYSRRADWDSPSYGTGAITKATIVSVEPYSNKHPVWSRNYDPYKVDKGPGVLVDLCDVYESREGVARREVVPLPHLRGLFAQTVAQLEEYALERDAADLERKKLRANTFQKCELAIGKLRELGYERTLVPTPDHYEVKVPVELLAQMADALAAAGWEYRK